MKSVFRLITFFIGAITLLDSCYPKKKIIARFPDGQTKVVRHYRHNNPNDEKLVSYYKNGKKEYVKYWKNDLMFKTKEQFWYESGAKQSLYIAKYKDTVRTTTYDPTDSVYTINVIGLSKEYYVTWNEKGKVTREEYSKNGERISYYKNSGGDSIRYKNVKKVRPDGYDSIKLTETGKKNGKAGVSSISRPVSKH